LPRSDSWRRRAGLGQSLMSAVTLTSPVDTNQLQRFSELPTEPALQQAAPFLVHLVRDPEFFEGQIRPLLDEARGAAGDWYVAHSYEGEDRTYSLQVFVWPPNAETKIHDHTSWGVYCCAVGSVLEERYERLDDSSRLGYACLKKIWQLSWSREDGVSTVLPYEGDIHRVGNPGASTAISVHLYGPQMGEVDGRDYDPSRNYVCDRLEV
jgi:predicted metal-dependent enzyme (double-stranded beta helix superfamily)